MLAARIDPSNPVERASEIGRVARLRAQMLEAASFWNR
jgi:hypothetical protein